MLQDTQRSNAGVITIHKEFSKASSLLDNFTNAFSGGEILFKAEGEIMSSTFGLKRRLPIIHKERIGQ